MENKLKAKQSDAGFSGLFGVKNATGEDRGSRNGSSGFSFIELMIVCSVIAIISAIALPNLIAQRRLLRSNAATREIMTQLRHARQLAMSERQAVTFQYNDVTKQIRIIDHNNDPTSATSGTAVLADPSYPNTSSPAVVVSTTSLILGGLPATEIVYGIPTTSTGLPYLHPTIPTGPLDDGVTMTPLASSILNITFQADGSVVPKTGIPVGGITLSQSNRGDAAMFIFNNNAASNTASAISVLGTSGRVKIWRYSISANKYVE